MIAEVIGGFRYKKDENKPTFAEISGIFFLEEYKSRNMLLETGIRIVDEENFVFSAPILSQENN